MADVRPLPTMGPYGPKDRTAAERQKRHRDKQKSVTRDVTPVTAVTPAIVDPPPLTGRVTPPVTPVTAGVDVAAYAAAIALAGCAAFFSIKGMVVLFPGAPTAVIGMAATMEGAKLVTAGWLAARWHVTPWVARLTLVTLIAGLAVINGIGVFSQLVAAHVGQLGEAASAIETQDVALAARIEVAAGKLADADRRLGQIDTAIEEAAKRGKTNTALSAIEGQRRARAALAGERNRPTPWLPSRRNAPAWPPRGTRSRPRPHRSATSPSSSVPIPTASGRSAG
jgi:hypothetical protein